ncbi:MAG: hypothetical protein IJQ08_00220 [Synergistaceae bacterium]|nr:hypothetical protein [Synergistaceae bacterium]
MSTQELQVDNDFESLIPPLTDDEYTCLEQSILAEGCRDPIITWNGIIIDGHHRFKICKKHKIDFQTVQKEFASRDEVILWMIQNQLGRRNLSEFQRVEIVRKYEEAVKAQAEQRMLAGKADPKVNLPEGQKSRKQSRDELGTLAGVSGSTYEHATKVLDHAPTTIVNAARNNQISIHAAYEITKLPVPQQTEIAQRIQQGEPAKSVIAEVKSRNRKPKTDTPANIADDVSPQSTTSEALFRSEELNVQHEANPATMNEEKQPKEVSTTQEAQTQHKEIPEQLQQDEVSEHSDNETLQPSQNKQHYERATQYDLHDYEEESNPNDYDDDERDVFEEYNQYEEYSRISIYKTDLRYNIIYAEPDWDSYQSTDELLTLPVGRVAEENCALLMWVNAPRLHEAKEVIKQWGFSNEKIAFVWVKTTEDDNGQQSYYLGQSGDLTRENVEFCLIATKGTIQRVNDNIPQGVLCPIEKEKPDYVKPELFKQLTVQLLGDLPALELFPDPEALFNEHQFSTKYNGKTIDWHMAAPEDFIEEQIANQRSWEI